LSGTGSAGATIRMYIEQYTDDKARLKEDAQVALKDIIKVRKCYIRSVTFCYERE
jgi:phosphoglucomutase